MTRDASIGVRNAAKRIRDESEPPWKRWRTKSPHARAIRFIETYCRPSKGYGHGKTLKLARFQKEFLEEALAADIGILQMPRGNGKSSLGGALAAWAVFDNDSTGAPQVPIIATTITQAIRSCYGVAASMIRNDPELANRCIPYTGIAQPRIVVPFNEGELFPISNDPEGLQGLDPSLAIVDEIGFQPVESWDSLRFAAGKREHSLTLGLGTPGTDPDVALFRIRDIVRKGNAPDGLIFHEHSAPEDADWKDPQTWRDANPALRAGFLREKALAVDFEIATETQFRIFHLGQWVDNPPESWLGDDARAIWDNLKDPWELVDKAPTWVGVDIALKRDTSAVVALQWREERLHARCWMWVPDEDRPVDTTDIMQHLRDLNARYDVQAISFDPRFFDVPAKYLEDEGLPMVEVPQSVERMTKAIGGVYELIKKGGLSHDGDPAFTRHILNAVPRFNERGFTLAKGKSRGHIDAAIALALAHDRVERQEEEPVVEFIPLEPDPLDEEEDW